MTATHSISKVLLTTAVACALAGASATSAQAENRVLHTTNSAGRTGAVYVPSGYNGQTLPLLVAFHGTGGDGRSMVEQFRTLADDKNFIILAPDSRRSPSGELTWQVGVNPGEVTEDLTHTQACLAELTAMPGVSIDKSRILALGYSGGGSLAPYVASRDSRFSAFAVLHGGVFAGGLGGNHPRGWFSTGDSDSERPPSVVQADMRTVSTAFKSVAWHTYSGGHELSDDERSAVVGWWLKSAE